MFALNRLEMGDVRDVWCDVMERRMTALLEDAKMKGA
jgi:hypothetical protein